MLDIRIVRILLSHQSAWKHDMKAFISAAHRYQIDTYVLCRNVAAEIDIDLSVQNPKICMYDDAME